MYYKEVEEAGHIRAKKVRVSGLRKPWRGEKAEAAARRRLS